MVAIDHYALKVNLQAAVRASTEGSRGRRSVKRPKFKTVLANYKTSGTHSCSMHFPNTCAIRMSEALVAAEPKLLAIFKNSIKNTCPHGYVRGAQDLGAILARAGVFGKRDFGWERPGSAPSSISAVSGVVCFMNIPNFSGQGHIDLWKRRGPVGSAYWSASPIWLWKLP